MKTKSFIALANSTDLTVENLRDQVRERALSDPRFSTGTVPAGQVAGSVWVQDLITPVAGSNWKAIIQAVDGKNYEVSFTVDAGKVTLAADAKEVTRVVQYEGLANSVDLIDVLGLENVLSMDQDGWALLAPFGEHKKERDVMLNGALVRERYIQIIDAESVDAVIANEKGSNLFQRIKRALVKRPIYQGHPDLKQYAPETVVAGNEVAVPIGLNDGCRRTARGLEFRPLLSPDGAVVAAENDGCKYPSALFLLKKTGKVRDGGWIEVRPFALASVGLTPFPNISGVDSLANARSNAPATKQNENQNNIMKQLLIGWLAGQGIVLANESTDQFVFEAFIKEMTTRTSNISALGNEKTTLTTTVNTITAERDAEKKRATEAVTALANEQEAAKKVRKQFLEARVDLAITQGKVAVADRVTEVTALENSKGLDADLEALDKRAVKFAVGTVAGGDRKADATTTTKTAHDQVIHLANNDPRYKEIKDFGEAFQKVLIDHPALAEQLRQKPEAVK